MKKVINIMVIHIMEQVEPIKIEKKQLTRRKYASNVINQLKNRKREIQIVNVNLVIQTIIIVIIGIKIKNHGVILKKFQTVMMTEMVKSG